MPFEVKELIEKVESIEVQPQIDKIQNAEIDALASIYIVSAIVVIYLFRHFLLDLLAFVFKIGIIGVFAFITYTLFFTT
jgi:hypothetical protein